MHGKSEIILTCPWAKRYYFARLKHKAHFKSRNRETFLKAPNKNDNDHLDQHLLERNNLLKILLYLWFESHRKLQYFCV